MWTAQRHGSPLATTKPHRTPGPPASSTSRPASGNAAAGHHQAGARRKTPRAGAKTPAPAGRLAATASRPTPGWAHASSRQTQRPTDRQVDLPRDTPKYDGNAKPEDWLLDYSTAAGIAKGNKRWAVRYSPLMLLGSARTWLNNLPAGSINGWLDFEEAFISNFTGTYRRPGRPQQLEMCKQGPDETDRAYLTCWCEMRNSCEGVHEIQAISFFMGGCRPNTMLWHKLRRSEPKTMAVLMAPAPSRRDNNKPAEHKPAEGGSHGSRRDNYRGKRHSDQPDRRYGSAQPCRTTRLAAAGASGPAPEAEVHL
ncbi:hypothetical protein QYE76_045899 [Lolium multiflorum]|uniref:Retrotransposon gag domain-containing protein n=1 Tax=Lolium multiflorum TaxID=4521 RepID=A0AAD8X073_LOLMU|nr:hypothetical protein QYE76_045899 [Lolium multiflorum]